MSFWRRFVNFGPVPAVLYSNLFPIPSAGLFPKVLLPSLATRANGNSRDFGHEVGHICAHTRSTAQASRMHPGRCWETLCFFCGFWLEVVRSTLPRSREAFGAASRLSASWNVILASFCHFSSCSRRAVPKPGSNTISRTLPEGFATNFGHQDQREQPTLWTRSRPHERPCSKHGAGFETAPREVSGDFVLILWLLA